MEPVLAVWAGYALGGQHVDPGPALQPYVQDALDEIEYVTGDASTKWGAVRAKDGHRAPFKLTYVEIGNEDFFDRSRSYDGRYAQFYDAIKAKYPHLQLIATTPVQSRSPDVVDDHYYRSARAMEADMHHYDNTDRNGPKIFVGEWASTEGTPTPNMNAALGRRARGLSAWKQFRPRGDGGLRAVAGQCESRRAAMGHGPHRLRRAAQFRVAVLLCAVHVRPKPRREHCARRSGRERGHQCARVCSARAPSASAPGARNAEYKDIKVTHDGATVFQSDFTSGIAGLERPQRRMVGA